MYTSIEKIVKLVDHIAPFGTQDSWDNSGLLIGNPAKMANRVLLALDVTESVVAEAIEGGFDVIITHHPLIFKGLKQITSQNRIGRLVMSLIQNDIALISAHTNVDRSFEHGTSKYLAERYALEEVQPINEEGYGVMGHLTEAISFEAFIAQSKSLFRTEHIRTDLAPETVKKVKTVAICSGAASEFISDAIRLNADVYVTGDLKYHDYQLAIGTNTTLIDVGHYESERLYMEALQQRLEQLAEEKSYDVYFEVSQEENPIIYTV